MSAIRRKLRGRTSKSPFLILFDIDKMIRKDVNLMFHSKKKKHVEYFYPTEPRRCFLFSNRKCVCSFINEYSFSLVLYSQLIIIFIYAVMLLVSSIYIYLMDRDVKGWRLRGERVSKQLVGRTETL